MIHEPECVFAGTHLQKDSCGTCNRLRTAYKRGREDAAEAVLKAAWNANGTIGLVDQTALYDVARGGDM